MARALTPEELEKYQQLADVSYDTNRFKELAKTLFPGLSFTALKTTVDNAVSRGHLVRGKAPPTDKERIGKLADLLEKAGIDIDDIGSLKQVKLNEWQGMYKDADGEAHKVDMQGMSVVINPKWADGPEWPVVQPVKPARVYPLKSAKWTKRKDKVAVILPDTQIHYWQDGTPFHDERAMNVALQAVNDLQPDLIVNLGDLIDLPTFSKYEQTPTFATATQKALERAHQWLAEQKANAPNAKIVYLEGNHDRRLLKYLTTNAAAAFGLTRVGTPKRWPTFSVPELLALDTLGVEYIDGYPAGRYWINDRLVCEHGHRVRSGSSTAQLVSHDERVSTIFGHVHRIETHYKTVQVRDGARTSFAASPGCLCRIDGAVPSVRGSTDTWGKPVLNYPENWQQGIGVVEYQEGDSPFDYHARYINTFGGYRLSVYGKVHHG